MKRYLASLFLGFSLIIIQIGSVSYARSPEVTAASISITSIYWSDADSGRLNGRVKFRLKDHDAPETGGVGRRGGAKCEYERKLGYESKAWVIGFTKDKELRVSNSYGLDKHGRLLIDLSADDVDVAKTGKKLGHLKYWPFIGNRSLFRKPNWCESA